jgi:hypothetical protein
MLINLQLNNPLVVLAQGGGAAYIGGGSAVKFDNCTFKENESDTVIGSLGLTPLPYVCNRNFSLNALKPRD